MHLKIEKPESLRIKGRLQGRIPNEGAGLARQPQPVIQPRQHRQVGRICGSDSSSRSSACHSRKRAANSWVDF